MLEDGIDMSHPDYKLVQHLGRGSFGIAKLMLYEPTAELVAVKFLERGPQIDKKVEREIVNHRALVHPNIVRFREVFLTSTHLAIAMEYAAGGELFDRIAGEGRFSEGEARYFFQQLVAGVQHCHSQGVCHRDLKLENALLDGLGLSPRLMICDFGYSKSAYFDSQPKSTVGTPNYLAPELLTRGASYDGQLADVWSCGVTLFVMLVGRYPFEDPSDPTFRRCIQRIRSAIYSIPSGVRLTRPCRDLISQIFVADPSQRITMEGIRRHPWFLENLNGELQDGASAARDRMLPGQQSMDDVRAVVREAQLRPAPVEPLGEAGDLEGAP